MNAKYKQYSEYFLLIVFLIIPKIDLIDFQNLYQGIRIEDIVSLYLAYILIYYKKVAINKQDVGYNFILYFFIYLMSCIIASMFFTQQWLILIRYLEYIVVIIYFNRNPIDTNVIFKVLKIYLLLNLIAVILQELSILGEFSSLGYESSFNKSDSRPTGLSGGPWELANCSAIVFFCIQMDKKQSAQSKFFYSMISLILIYMTFSRTVFIAMTFVLSIYAYQKYTVRKQLFYILVLLGTFSIAYFSSNVAIKLDTAYKQVPQMFIDIVINRELADLGLYNGKLWSVWIRLNFWLSFYEYYSTNLITYLFGIGAVGMYMESAILRVIFGSGLVGLVFVLYSIRKIPLYMLLFILISGLTLDLMVSSKIFFTFFIYFYLLKRVGNENRN